MVWGSFPIASRPIRLVWGRIQTVSRPIRSPWAEYQPYPAPYHWYGAVSRPYPAPYGRQGRNINRIPPHTIGMGQFPDRIPSHTAGMGQNTNRIPSHIIGMGLNSDGIARHINPISSDFAGWLGYFGAGADILFASPVDFKAVMHIGRLALVLPIECCQRRRGLWGGITEQFCGLYAGEFSGERHWPGSARLAMVPDQGVRLGQQQQHAHAVQQCRLPRPGAIAVGDGRWELEDGQVGRVTPCAPSW